MTFFKQALIEIRATPFPPVTEQAQMRIKPVPTEESLNFLDFILPETTVLDIEHTNETQQLSVQDKTPKAVEHADTQNKELSPAHKPEHTITENKTTPHASDLPDKLTDSERLFKDSTFEPLYKDENNYAAPNVILPNFIMPSYFPGFQWHTDTGASKADSVSGYSLIEPEALAEAISQARSRQSSIRVDVTEHTSVILRFAGNQVGASFLTGDQLSTLQLAQAIQVFQQRALKENLPISDISVTHEERARKPFEDTQQKKQEKNSN